MATRITRLVSLLQLLHSGYDANKLAKVCGVSRQTILRDLKSLRAAGLPVVYDRRRRCYYVEDHAALRPTNLTLAEGLALMTLALTVRGSQAPYAEAALSAANKVIETLPASVRQRLQDAQGFIRAKSPSGEMRGAIHAVHQQLVDARAAQRVVQIEYVSRDSRQREMIRFRVYNLLFTASRWYAIGRSSGHRTAIALDVSRIANLTVLKTTYAIPKSFNIDAPFGKAWHLIGGRGRVFNVALRFSRLVAAMVAGIQWHPTQQADIQPDGTLIFRVTVSALDEIVWWILGFGDQVEVLSPDRLRRFVAQRARNLAGIYGMN